VLGRAGHAQRLMRPFGVVAGDEVVELRLLLQEVPACRLGCLQLQSQVHALVTSVLLRVARLDPLDLNAEPQPPHRELREVEQGIGAGEGHAVVGADGAWQARSYALRRAAGR
jgi:hypothetical protein